MSRKSIGGNSVEQLKSVISRVERLEEEKAELAADIREVFAEAKGNGFDTAAIRQIIKLRKMDAQEREEKETVLDTYMRALGMQPDLFDDGRDPPPADEMDEKQYATAVEIVTRDRKASTSYLQRCMTIGYNRAASLIERMEHDGVVSAANHIGKREVLVGAAKDGEAA
jgi:uncharacterized protein (UPF0335 family)